MKNVLKILIFLAYYRREFLKKTFNKKKIILKPIAFSKNGNLFKRELIDLSL